MKVGVPSMGESGLDEEVSQHFGRAPTYTIIDTEEEEVDVVPNTSEHAGGSGKPPEIMEENNVEVMLCSNLGPRAIKMFENLGIEVFVGADGEVREALQAWKEGNLTEATDKDACEQHRH